MELRFCLLGSLLSATLLLSTTESAIAQLSGVDAESFQKIEQTTALRAGITTAGLGLMGIELWWFLFSKAKVKSEQATVRVNAASGPVVSYLDFEAIAAEATEMGETIDIEAVAVTSRNFETVASVLATDAERAGTANIAAAEKAAGSPAQALIELKQAIEGYLNNPFYLSDRIATNIRSACNGIQIPLGVLTVEDAIGPKFSMNLGQPLGA